MDRDRRPDRRYDDRPSGPSDRGAYRPYPRHGRSPPPPHRGDGYRSGRDATYVRGRSPPPPVDSYAPSERGPHPRTRSPGYAPRRTSRSPQPSYRYRNISPLPGSGWKGRERSPPRRVVSPRRESIRRDERPPRSPPPPAPPARRGRSRSPYAGGSRRFSPRPARERSPIGMKRGRELSPPDGYGTMRDTSPPPPPKRERMASPLPPLPRGRYDQPREPREPLRRPVSPPRERRFSPPGGPRGGWRGRSRSPVRREGNYPPAPAQTSNQWRDRSVSPGPHRTSHPEPMSGRDSVTPPPRAMSPDDLRYNLPARASRSNDQSRASPGWGGGVADGDEEEYGTSRAPPPLAPSGPARTRSPTAHASYHEDDRSAHRERERERSPAPTGEYSGGPPSPRELAEHRSPPRRREYSPRRDSEPEYRRDGRDGNRFAPPSEPSYRNGHASGPSRGPPPPSGPSGGSGPPPRGYQAGPAMSMSAHNRPGNVSMLSAPSQPRGGALPPGPPRRDYGHSYGGPHPPPRRGGGGPYHHPPPPPSSSYIGGGRGHYGPPPLGGPRDRDRDRDRSPQGGSHHDSSRGGGSGGVPTGPRSGPGHPTGSGGSSYYPSYHHGHHGGHHHHQGPSHYQPPPPVYPIPRSSHNSTSRTYPLTQRFSNSGSASSRHLNDLPSIVPGGRALPSGIDKNVAEKLAKIEQEQKKLEEELQRKMEKTRAGLRQWERGERESERDGLRSELAEEQVRVMSEEGGGGVGSGDAF